MTTLFQYLERIAIISIPEVIVFLSLIPYPTKARAKVCKQFSSAKYLTEIGRACRTSWRPSPLT